MKMQFINVPADKFPDPWYMPLGQILLGNAIKDISDVEILDGTIISRKEILNRIDADVVGINYTTLSVKNIPEFVKVAKAKGSYVVFGGHAATAEPLSLFELPETDAVVVGSGETALRNLLENKLNPSQSPNTYYRKNGQIIKPSKQIDDPLPHSFKSFSRHIHGLDVEKYLENYVKTTTFPHIVANRPMNILSQKGCPERCSFCARYDKKIKRRNPKDVIDEINYLIDEYRIDYVFDTADTWALGSKWIDEFSQMYSPQIPMSIFANIRDITLNKLDKMKKCGIENILFGIESGSEKILKSNGKRYSLQRIKDVVKQTTQRGISVSGSFVIGLIGEDYKSLNETTQLIDELSVNEKFHPYMNIIIPLPGSPLWKDFTMDKKFIDKYNNSLSYNLKETRSDFLNARTSVELGDLRKVRDSLNLKAGLETQVEYAR